MKTFKHLRIARRLVLCALASLWMAGAACAQAPLETGKLEFTYRFQSTEGTNASAVAYVPGPNVYITVIAGNETFPMEVFDQQGKTIASQEVGLDIRGVWYNPETKALEGNGAGELGWYTMPLDANGLPAGDWEVITDGQLQPDYQSVLSYVTPKKKLVTFNNGFFSYWGRKKAKEKVRVQYGTPGNTNWFIDPTTAAYTGNDDFPIAVLELNVGQILYFNLKGRYLGATIIPDTDPEITGFRFAFANGFAFVFDKEERTWRAYRVF